MTAICSMAIVVMVMADFTKNSNSKKLSTRAQVIIGLDNIQNGQSLSAFFDDLLKQVSPADKGFAHELILGTLRQWWALCRISESLVENPITDNSLLSGLNIGLYQILYLNTPDYAAINQTVEAIKELKKPYGASLLNAILRKVAKNRDKYFKKINKNHSLPNWLAKQLKQDWTHQYLELGQSLRQIAPIFIRANTTKIGHHDYQKLLDAQNIHHQSIQTNTEVLNKKTSTKTFKIDGKNIGNLPNFSAGFTTIQDIHAQISGDILALLQDELSNQPLNLLDACCAPAGKLTHWLEKLEGYHYYLTAIDNDEKRLKRVFENVQRLGFDNLINKELTIQSADATTYKSNQPFDIILLDAPCSATGVIRRHPDITLLRQENDIKKIVQLQKAILENLWQNVAKGGFLLYITCSILKAENQTQIGNFLNTHSNAKEVKINADWGFAQDIGRQCLPTIDGGDGFYYALLQKI